MKKIFIVLISLFFLLEVSTQSKFIKWKYENIIITEINESNKKYSELVTIKKHN